MFPLSKSSSITTLTYQKSFILTIVASFFFFFKLLLIKKLCNLKIINTERQIQPLKFLWRGFKELWTFSIFFFVRFFFFFFFFHGICQRRTCVHDLVFWDGNNTRRLTNNCNSVSPANPEVHATQRNTHSSLFLKKKKKKLLLFMKLILFARHFFSMVKLC